MKDSEQGLWEQARMKVIARWQEILRRIDARDEGAVLGLANVIDEFCEEAIAARAAVLQGHVPPESDLLKFSSVEGTVGTRCLFCRGFQETGGCFGMLANLNSLVLHGKWDEARRVAEMYIRRLESMYFVDIPMPSIH